MHILPFYIYGGKIKQIESGMKNETKGKIKIGKYSRAWNCLSTKGQAVKSYALARGGPNVGSSLPVGQ